MQFLIDIKNKIATAADDYKIVCGNSDYTVKFTFDEEWSKHTTKTARFSFIQEGVKKFIDVVFEGVECFAPILSNTHSVEIGVFAGDLQTTTPCILTCEKSILCEKGLPEAPAPNVYNQIIEICEETEEIAKSVEKRADNGEFNGVFIATYNVTTRAELDEAYKAGKTIICKYTHREGTAALDFFGPLAQRSDFLEAGGLLTYTFAITVGKTIYNATLTHEPKANDLWQIIDVTIPEPEFYLATYGKTTIAQLNGAFEEGKIIIVAYPEEGDYNKIKFFPIAERGVISQDWVEIPATYTNDGKGITAQFDKSVEATDIRIQLLDTTHDTSPWAKPGYGVSEGTYFPSWVGLNKIELLGTSNEGLTIKGADAWGQPLVFTKQYETSFGQVLDMYNNGFGEDYTYLYVPDLNILLKGGNTYLGGGWWQTGGPGPVNHWPLNIDVNTGDNSKLISGLRVTNFTATNMGVPQNIKVYKKNAFSQLPEIVYSFYCVNGNSISKITCSDGVWNITTSNYATEQYVNNAINSAKESVIALIGG